MDPLTWSLIIGGLVGATIGGLSSAATNQDPWKGAALGGLLGGATAGVGGFISPAVSAATAATEAAGASAMEAGIATAMAEPLVTGAEAAGLAGTTQAMATPTAMGAVEMAAAGSPAISAAQSGMPGLSAPITGGMGSWPSLPQYLQYGQGMSGLSDKVNWLGKPIVDAFGSSAGEAGQFGGSMGSQLAYEPPEQPLMPNYYQAYGGIRNSITQDPLFKDIISMKDDYGLLYGGSALR